jgi:hypothetical protein
MVGGPHLSPPHTAMHPHRLIVEDIFFLVSPFLKAFYRHVGWLLVLFTRNILEGHWDHRLRSLISIMEKISLRGTSHQRGDSMRVV